MYGRYSRSHTDLLAGLVPFGGGPLLGRHLHEERGLRAPRRGYGGFTGSYDRGYSYHGGESVCEYCLDRLETLQQLGQRHLERVQNDYCDIPGCYYYEDYLDYDSGYGGYSGRYLDRRSYDPLPLGRGNGRLGGYQARRGLGGGYPSILGRFGRY